MAFTKVWLHGSRGFQSMADRRKAQNFGALPQYLTNEIWDALSAGSKEQNCNLLLGHCWSLGLRCPSEGTFSTVYNILEATGRDTGRSPRCFRTLLRLCLSSRKPGKSTKRSERLMITNTESTSWRCRKTQGTFQPNGIFNPLLMTCQCQVASGLVSCWSFNRLAV